MPDAGERFCIFSGRPILISPLKKPNAGSILLRGGLRPHKTHYYVMSIYSKSTKN